MNGIALLGVQVGIAFVAGVILALVIAEHDY